MDSSAEAEMMLLLPLYDISSVETGVGSPMDHLLMKAKNAAVPSVEDCSGNGMESQNF